MKDSMIVGLISGTAGAVAIELLNVLMGKNLFFGKIASSMVVNPLRSKGFKNMLLGEFMHLTVGAGIGTVIVALVKKTGKNLIFIKGIFVSLLAWVGLHNLGNRMDLFSIKPHSTKNHYFALIQHLFYGITTSAVIQYIANPVIFQHSSKKQTIKRSLNYTEQLLPYEPVDKTLDPQGERK
jgi:hypothetical protein